MKRAHARPPGRIARAVDDLAARLRARFGERVRELTLYGSHARGDARQDSDVDVFVRIDGLTEAERQAVFELAADVSIQHLVTVQALAPLPGEHEWLERNECRILRDIASEGITL